MILVKLHKCSIDYVDLQLQVVFVRVKKEDKSLTKIVVRYVSWKFIGMCVYIYFQKQ